MNPHPHSPERGLGRAPLPPKPATRLVVGVAIAIAGVITVAWTVLVALRSVLQQAGLLNAWADLGVWLLGALPLLLLIPLVRAIQELIKAARSLGRSDLPEARAHTAEARDWAWFAFGYGIAGLMVYLGILFLIANNAAVAQTFLKLSLIASSFQLILKAFWLNVFIFCVAQVFILIWGLVIAVARMVPGRGGQPIRFLATLYTDVFRALPSIIAIYLVGLGLPLAGVPWVQDWPLEWLAILALTLTYGAYVAEVYRSGIESIHPSQMMAARSLGLSFGQTLRFVIVPQAIRRIIPPLLNDFIALQKDTALVNIIGAIDAFNQARIIASNNFNLSAVTTVALLFILITIPQARLVDRLIEREQKRTRAGGGS